MKLAVFGTQNELETALASLKIEPEEVHAPSEFTIDSICKARKITLKKYGIDWDSIDLPNALVKTNKNGKEYNARAPMVRNSMILDNATHVLLLGQDNGNQYIEKSVSWIKKNGGKIELLKWPKVQEPVATVTQDVPEDDIPF